MKGTNQKRLKSCGIDKAEKGMILVIAIAIMAVLTLISTYAIKTTTTDLKISSNYKRGVKAFYNSEAGIHDGIGRLVNGTISDSGAETNPHWNSASNYSSTGVNNSFTVTHYLRGNNVVTDANGNPLYLITSTGTSSTSKKQIESVVGLVYASPFANALHGCDGVTIGSNGLTDSYDSAIGSYSSQVITGRSDDQGNEWAGDNGDIGTSNAGANITIDGNAQIHGDAKATGDVGDPGIGAPTSGLGNPANLTGYIGPPDTDGINAVIYGTPEENADTSDCDPLDTTTLFDTADDIVTTNNNGEIADCCGQSDYPYDTSTKTFRLDSNDTYALGNAGQKKDYYFTDFDLKSNSELTINGDVTLYVDGSSEFHSNTQLILSSGSKLTVYVTDFLRFDSNTVTNPGKPTDLMIYSSANSGSPSDYKVEINSNAEVKAAVYAPFANVRINSNGDVMGAIRGKQVSSDSNAAFHYDEALGRLDGGPIIGHTIISWREIN